MPRRTGRRQTIGAVLAQVRDEFPDVTISKIRFLEAEGLIEPERTPSGYRVYGPADVDRLRYILRAQRDQFWPLRVIRESLDALDRGLEPSEGPGGATGLLRAPRPSPDPDASLPPSGRDARAVRLMATELAEAAGLETGTISELVTHGLVRPDASGHFDEHALRVVHAVAGLAAHGFGPRHLRPFRTAADREIGLVQQAAAGHPLSRRQSAASEVATLCLQLHAALLKAGLDSS